MPTYLSPGVYVEEVPSAVKAIAGVGTSTAGFIGVVPSKLDQPLSRSTDVAIGKGDGTNKDFEASVYPVNETASKIKVNGAEATGVKLENDKIRKVLKVTFTTAPEKDAAISGDLLPFCETAPAGEAKLCTNFGEFKKFFGDFAGNRATATWPTRSTASSTTAALAVTSCACRKRRTFRRS